MNLRILRYHEETVYTVAFSPDSRVLLSACNMGSLRFMIVDNENASESLTEFDCAVDAAHDLGVCSSDFSKISHTDPEISIKEGPWFWGLPDFGIGPILFIFQILAI
uniref:Anaphase-promoting complex subunit 4 WD40 domain-containing protein n=1 Tax=Megaselia scalaris TaxID=36166 RepID=T1GHS5_MEGSC